MLLIVFVGFEEVWEEIWRLLVRGWVWWRMDDGCMEDGCVGEICWLGSEIFGLYSSMRGLYGLA